jgi:hypothetical protein
MAQKETQETDLFGAKLRYYRGRAHDPRTGRSLSQQKLGEYLKDRIGWPVSRNRINDWENGHGYLHPDKNRDLLVAIVAVLHKYGGVQSLEEANELLKAGKYLVLDESEKIEVDSKWARAISDRTLNAVSLPELGLPGSSRPKEEHNSKTVFLAPPLPEQGVFGRKKAISSVIHHLQLEEESPENVQSLSLLGMGGIGKTTLAIALAYMGEISSAFPDGILWTSLGPRPTVRLLLEAWGRALGLDLLPEHDEAACQERVRQELHERRMLIIVDDVWDIIQGRFFKVGGPACRTLFTTREGPIATALAGRGRTQRVGVLSLDAALKLLRKLAPEVSKVDRKITTSLCARLEYLPLGLTLAGHMLANEADVPQRMQRVLEELIDRGEARLQLLQAEGRKGVDEENPVSLQAILGLSVERLTKPDQECFARLSIFGGEPLTWEMNAVSAIWECPREEAEAVMSRLVQRGLVEPRGNRYWMHALLADYGGQMRKKMNL